MRKPRAYFGGHGDTRSGPAGWVEPHHLAGMDITSELLIKAGYEPVPLQRGLIQSVHDAALAMEPIVKEGQPGDLFVSMSTGWGLPGIFKAMMNRIRKPVLNGSVGVHLLSNLLAQYPGFVLASAQAHVCRAAGYKFTRDIVLDWNNPVHVERLRQRRETGEVKIDFQKEYGDGKPGEVKVDEADKKEAAEVLRRIDGMIYGGIGVRSMLMDQGGVNEFLLQQLGLNFIDIGALEMKAEADAIQKWRAKMAMDFCVDRGLKVNVPEEIFGRQMQILLAIRHLMDKYHLNFVGYQGQFDQTVYDVAEDMALALLNSRQQPEGDGKARVGATERDFYAAVTMMLMQLCVAVRYQTPNDPVAFHDLRHIVELLIKMPGMPKAMKRWFVVLLNSGALNLRDLTGSNETMEGVEADSQNPAYFRNGGAASKGQMVHLGRIIDYPGGQDARRVGTWARLIPVGKNGLTNSFMLVAGHYDLMTLTPEIRQKHPVLKLLDAQWPMGVAGSNCPWQILFGVDCNHIQSVPFDILSLLAAIAQLMGWIFVPIGVGLDNPIPGAAEIVLPEAEETA
ncbi:MAG: hypothetical protein WCW26_02025 [Candidatus Buchananbacteria bacterium]